MVALQDHPSDKPESMDLSFTVPEGSWWRPTVAGSEGSTLAGKTTSRWRVSTPIANYTVAFNAAPYVELVGSLESVAGDTFPVIFWVLPENEEKGEAFMAEILEHLRFFERFCGPYPFRGDKYGVVETRTSGWSTSRSSPTATSTAAIRTSTTTGCTTTSWPTSGGRT